MRTCTKHWSGMRSALEARGLTQFVSRSGEEAADKFIQIETAKLKEEEAPKESFDPLMMMEMNFTNRVMALIGLSIMGNRVEDDGMPENKDEEGFNHVCSLCVVRHNYNRHNTPTGCCDSPDCKVQMPVGSPPTDEEWIEGCADFALKAAVEKKLITVN